MTLIVTVRVMTVGVMVVTMMAMLTMMVVMQKSSASDFPSSWTSWLGLCCPRYRSQQGRSERCKEQFYLSNIHVHRSTEAPLLLGSVIRRMCLALEWRAETALAPSTCL